MDGHNHTPTPTPTPTPSSYAEMLSALGNDLDQHSNQLGDLDSQVKQVAMAQKNSHQELGAIITEVHQRLEAMDDLTRAYHAMNSRIEEVKQITDKKYEQAIVIPLANRLGEVMRLIEQASSSLSTSADDNSSLENLLDSAINSLIDTLASYQVELLYPEVEESFDPAKMRPVGIVCCSNLEADNTVFETIHSGTIYRDQVLNPAEVKILKYNSALRDDTNFNHHERTL